LNQRIDRRVDAMMQEGLLEEVKNLIELKNLNALKTVGYTELFQYLQDAFSLEDAVAQIKVNTRQYAKRQMTWFKKDPFLVLYCQNEKCCLLKDEAPKPIGCLSDESRLHFKEVLEYWESLDIPYKINNCLAYHAGLSDIKRKEIQLKFISGEINIIVSTIAFGMGIDQTIRCVLIFGCPKSVEEYYQQIGRGGRDGKYCETVLYYDYGLSKKLYFMIKKDLNNRNNLNNLNNIEKYYFTKTCRRRFILEYLGFGEDNYFLLHTFTCSNCDNCNKNNLVDYTQDFIENNKKSYSLKQKYNLHIVINYWKNYIAINKLNYKNIPLNNRIRLPEENIISNSDIYDKCEKIYLKI
jgi:superfamily II DNA or RNA helicase